MDKMGKAEVWTTLGSENDGHYGMNDEASVGNDEVDERNEYIMEKNEAECARNEAEDAHNSGQDTLETRNDVYNLVKQTSLRWIFVGGKGGVGKTTVSCSIAAILADHRESVLLLSTDPAHSLSDAFDQKFTSHPRLVNGFTNLYAMELDAGSVSDTGFGSLAPKGLLDSIPDLFQMFPGIDEALSFAELIQSVQSMKYSVIIFDTAPTGHTLKFLNLPDLLDKLVDGLLKVESFFGIFMRMLSLVNSQTSRSEMFEKIKELKRTITLTMEQMKNPELTTFICVCIPEFLSVYETERLIQYLARNDIDCSYIIINQVLMYFDLEGAISRAQRSLEDVKEETREIFENLLVQVREQQKMLRGRMSVQKRYIDDVKELYDNYFNIVAIPQHKDEVRGPEAIKEFSKMLLEHSPVP